MNKNDETVQRILADKPIKPVLEEFSLTESKVKELEQFKSKCESKSKLYTGIAFGIISGLAALIIILNGSGYGYIILTTIASAIMSWGIIPFIIKLTCFLAGVPPASAEQTNLCHCYNRLLLSCDNKEVGESLYNL